MTLVIDNVNHGPDVIVIPDPTLRVEIDITNLPTNPVRVWTDITAFAKETSFTRAGRSSDRETTQPGSFSVTVDNNEDSPAAQAISATGRPFDRDNTDGPFYPGLKWTFWVRFTAIYQTGLYVQFTGLKESLHKERGPGGIWHTATIQGPDAMKPLELFGLGGLSFPAASTGTRVTEVLASAGIAAGTIAAGYPRLLLPAVSFDTSDETSALSHLQAVEQDERGLLFAGGDGRIYFQDRYHRARLIIDGPVATLGETNTTVRYSAGGDLDDDGGYRFNSVAVTPAGGETQVSRDQASIDESFERRLSLSMLCDNEVQAHGNASWYRHRYADPDQRVGPLEIKGSRTPDLWPAILSAENSELFTWAALGGTTLVHLERVSQTWRPKEPPDITWELSPASREQIWRLGVPGQSELGVTTRLG